MEITAEFLDWSEPGPEKSAARSIADAADERRVIAAKAGDDEAFRELIESHQARIYHFCYQWLRDAEEARETCQDTFISAYQALDRYESRGKFRVWLYRIALNHARDRHKSRAARQRRANLPLADLASAPACKAPSPDEAVSRAELVDQLHEQIDALPDKLRAVTVLCCVEGLSHATAGQVLGCSPRAIEGRLYRARKSLDEWWEKQ